MYADTETVSRLCENINKTLVGGRITEVFKSDDGFYGFTVVKGGKTYNTWVNQDPEGNGPGFLSIE